MRINILSGRTLRGFMESEKSGGLVLIVCTIEDRVIFAINCILIHYKIFSSHR